MWNARLDEAQAGINIAMRHINNLRQADDTTLMAESEEELKRLFAIWMAFCHYGSCHKGGVICISEVIDISPGNLDFSLGFIQLSFSHDLL